MCEVLFTACFPVFGVWQAIQTLAQAPPKVPPNSHVSILVFGEITGHLIIFKKMLYCLLSRAQAMPRKRSDIEFFQQLMFGPSLASIANGHVMLQITVRSQICNLVFWENNWSDSSETQNYRFLHQDPSQYSPFKQWKCVPVMFDEQQLIEFVDMLVLLLVMITRFYRIRQMRLEMTRSILLMNENQRRQRREVLSGHLNMF